MIFYQILFFKNKYTHIICQFNKNMIKQSIIWISLLLITISIKLGPHYIQPQLKESSAIKKQQTDKNMNIQLTLKENQQYFTIPIQIQKQKLEFIIDNKQPSWAFIGTGSICVKDKCNSHQNKLACNDCKKQKYTKQNQQGEIIIQSKQISEIKYIIQGKQMSEQFILASKASFQNSIDKIDGMLNIKHWPIMHLYEQKNIPSINFTQQTKGWKQIEKNDQQKNAEYIIINEAKSTKIQLSDTKLKFEFKNYPQALLAFPKNIINQLKKEIVKKYFNNDCSFQESTITCKNKITPINYPLDICFDNTNCMRINLNTLVRKDNAKKYTFLFSQSQQDIIIYPSFLKYYEFQLNKGEIQSYKKADNYQLVQLYQQPNDGESLQGAPAIFKPFKKKNNQVNKKEKQQSSGWFFKIFIWIIIYSIIGGVIIFVIKTKVGDSYVANSINFLLGMIAGIFHRKQGYQPQINSPQQMDDENSVNVGYKKNSQVEAMFWQKNSVEGI